MMKTRLISKKKLQVGRWNGSGWCGVHETQFRRVEVSWADRQAFE